MDREIEFLINSEFSDNYRNDELKSFLMKFKYYFRMVWSQSQTRKVEFENTIQRLQNENLDLKSKLSQSEDENSRLRNQILNLKNRSLFQRILNS